MRKGYYYSYWPDDLAAREQHWDEIKSYVNVYLDWELGRQAFPKILLGKKVWVDIGMYGFTKETATHVQAVIDAIKHRWNKIIALEMADEPKWSPARTGQLARMVKNVIRANGLEPKPIGVTPVIDRIPLLGYAPDIDYLGVEAYLDYIPGESVAAAQSRVRRTIWQRVGSIAPEKRVILIAQTYDRNGAWKDINTLVGIQQPTFEEARLLGKRLIQLSLFAYARTGGALSHPTLKAEIKRLIRLYP